jgi:hypothetical protein
MPGALAIPRGGVAVTHDFCTYFDSNYLDRGLALYLSLQAHAPGSRLYVLAMDEPCRDILRRLELPGLHAVSMADFEADDTALLAAKKNRSRVEYYFTCTPSFILYLLRNRPDLDTLTYLDADLFFFSSPEPVYQEIGSRPLAIIPHRFSPWLKKFEMYGLYNVGFLYFKRCPTALSCLERWRGQCIQWCFDRAEKGRFADQKYLDEWPERYGSDLAVIRHPGANLAPWNLGRYRLSVGSGGLRIDDRDLIFFHFQGFKPITRWLFDPNLRIFRTRLSRVMKRRIYLPYIRILERLRPKMTALVRKETVRDSLKYQYANSPMRVRIWKVLNKAVLFALFLAAGSPIVVARGGPRQEKKW